VAADTNATTTTIRVKTKIDGTNARTIDKKDYSPVDDFAADIEPGIPIEIPPVCQDVSVTCQFAATLAATAVIYYSYVKESLE